MDRVMRMGFGMLLVGLVSLWVLCNTHGRSMMPSEALAMSVDRSAKEAVPVITDTLVDTAEFDPELFCRQLMTFVEHEWDELPPGLGGQFQEAVEDIVALKTGTELPESIDETRFVDQYWMHYDRESGGYRLEVPLAYDDILIEVKNRHIYWEEAGRVHGGGNEVSIYGVTAVDEVEDFLDNYSGDLVNVVLS